MRPCAEPLITKATEVAAADAIAANGQRFPAMVCLTRDRASVNGLMIYLDRTFEGRVIELRCRKDGTWREYSSHSHWTSLKSEPRLLPVRVVTRASHKATGVPISIEIPDVQEPPSSPRPPSPTSSPWPPPIPPRKHVE